MPTICDEDGGLNNDFQTDDEGNTVTTNQFFGPGMASKEQRSGNWSDELRHALVDAGFYQDDLATVMVAYTEMTVRRGVWQNRFGYREGEITVPLTRRFDRIGANPHSPVAKLVLKVEEGFSRGELNQWQRDRIINDILPAYAGQLGFKVHSKVRDLSAWAVIYQNLRVLPFAIFSQFVDVATIFARGDWQAHQAGLRGILNKASRAEAYEMLQAVGAMRQGLTEHILNDQALNTFYTGNAKRINDLFFRYNMMEGWTNAMRAMALMSAREFIQRNGRKAMEGNAKSERYIRELGLTPQQATAWDGMSLTDENIKAAINRYIDEGMIRPDPSIRPVWMSDPGYLIFTHLKPFLYGFHETFLRRVGREAKIHQNLLPALTLLMLTLPFAAVGYDLRRKITGRGNAPEGVDYAQELFERAGLFGVFQLVMDMEQADQYGKPMAVALAGPTAEHLYTFLTTDDKDIVMAKSIPVVAQIPAARQWIKDQDVFGE
jgi:hypothetical protein